MSKDYVKRGCRFPKDLYDEMEKIAEEKEITIMQLIIQTLRDGLNIPKVKKEDE